MSDAHANDSPDAKEPTRRRRPARHQVVGLKPVSSRRGFLAAGVGFLTAGLTLGRKLLGDAQVWAETGRKPLRPPTASADDAEFRALCIRCGLCGTVCENGCIRYFGLGETQWGVFSPYIDARRRSCTLCMRCTQICPTGALTPVEKDFTAIREHVHMGTAVVDPDRCLSYLGRVCGYCHDACPLPNVAIKLIPPAYPVILTDGCVGCGRCEELCPQSPLAIWVERPGEEA
ncbi:MAG: 4Fe-4S dicluster domain-containing protein [Myxococcales bacterium]|nr:4Fe-4S dicluster domain-containing protein [Myxococcales bacterium]